MQKPFSVDIVFLLNCPLVSEEEYQIDAFHIVHFADFLFALHPNSKILRGGGYTPRY